MSAVSHSTAPLSEQIGPENLTVLWGKESLPISDTPANFLVAVGRGSGKTITRRLLIQSAPSPTPHNGNSRRFRSPLEIIEPTDATCADEARRKERLPWPRGSTMVGRYKPHPPSSVS